MQVAEPVSDRRALGQGLAGAIEVAEAELGVPLRGEREGSMIGTGYRHMTEAMHRRPLHPDRESYPVMFGRVRRAELPRACRANARAPYRRRGAVGTTFVSPTAGRKLTGEVRSPLIRPLWWNSGSE